MGALPDELSEQFCAHYVNTLNSAEAFRRTHKPFIPEQLEAMSDHEVARRGGSFMNRKGVKDRIRELMQERSNVSVERVTDEYEEIAFANIKDFAEWSEGELTLIASEDIDERKARAIKSIKQTQYGLAIEMHDKMGALEKLGRRFKKLHRPDKGEGDKDKPTPTLMLFNADDEEQSKAALAMQDRLEEAEKVENGSEES